MTKFDCITTTFLSNLKFVIDRFAVLLGEINDMREPFFSALKNCQVQTMS